MTHAYNKNIIKISVSNLKSLRSKMNTLTKDINTRTLKKPFKPISRKKGLIRTKRKRSKEFSLKKLKAKMNIMSTKRKLSLNTLRIFKTPITINVEPKSRYCIIVISVMFIYVLDITFLDPIL